MSLKKLLKNLIKNLDVHIVLVAEFYGIIYIMEEAHKSY